MTNCFRIVLGAKTAPSITDRHVKVSTQIVIFQLVSLGPGLPIKLAMRVRYSSNSFDNEKLVQQFILILDYHGTAPFSENESRAIRVTLYVVLEFSTIALADYCYK